MGASKARKIVVQRRSVDQPGRSRSSKNTRLLRRRKGIQDRLEPMGLRYQIEVGSTFRSLGQKVHL